jgi:hypothetical protein
MPGVGVSQYHARPSLSEGGPYQRAQEVIDFICRKAGEFICAIMWARAHN